MQVDAAELARRLAQNAEAVCRHYLSNGRREGRYWLVGDARNTPGRSMFVRLSTSTKGPAGKWSDGATGEHGDLLDVIRESRGLLDFREVIGEARRFLSMPCREPPPLALAAVPGGSPEASRRLFAMAQPIEGTLVETYLRNRGITALHETDALRFHARCYHRPHKNAPTETRPAMIAAVRDLGRHLTGAHRTWLNPNGFDPVHLGKARIETPRRAMGDLLGNAVWFGTVSDVLAAGEGIETMLSPRCLLPMLPTAAALSANHLAALVFPATLRRLYIARDNDPAGDAAAVTLTTRAAALGIAAITLTPLLGDFNEDLRKLGLGALRANLGPQLALDDLGRFLPAA